MSRIFCIVGKSASGKDTIYKRIISNCCEKLVPIIPYTTRPKRTGEIDGVDYNFVSEKQLRIFEKEGKIIEKRRYSTTQGLWYYFTLKFNVVKNNDYILITTLDGAAKLMEQYGNDMLHIVYLTIEDKVRLLRCIERESKQKEPDYSEVCRRFMADQSDFSNYRISIFKNVHYIDTNFDVETCLEKWSEIYLNAN